MLPVLGVDTETDVQAVSPAVWKALTAPEPVTPARAAVSADDAPEVVATVSDTITLD